MISNILLDINILLNFFLKRRDFDVAEKVLILAKDNEVKAFVGISILQTTSFYLQKSYGSKISKELLLELLLIVNIIEADEEIVLQALNSSIADIEDAVHFYTATKHKLDYILSSDIAFQKLSNKNLQITSAEKFLALF
ncbi:PIN domain-containing protein [Pedobacter changchengzhani]|uniref:PIN domain-containing protein n=1 Tax=Pedobacter changchengzhani TaxID=2529274 RepID=A0A4R5MIG4_9SPHI|nr:PIN domain-containing protein [Pedobacter changchengzhani]TDG35387.1 PIN domain-containing protein [Pedobacter changchengzhani]